jgi:hypothetical protein
MKQIFSCMAFLLISASSFATEMVDTKAYFIETGDRHRILSTLLLQYDDKLSGLSSFFEGDTFDLRLKKHGVDTIQPEFGEFQTKVDCKHGRCEGTINGEKTWYTVTRTRSEGGEVVALKGLLGKQYFDLLYSPTGITGTGRGTIDLKKDEQGILRGDAKGLAKLGDATVSVKTNGTSMGEREDAIDLVVLFVVPLSGIHVEE